MNIRNKILELFFRESEKEFHVREIARMLKKSPTTISSYLKKLEKEKIIVLESKLNHSLFRANSGHPNFKAMKLYYNLAKLRDSGLIDYLTNEFNKPEVIILFGSFAKAENTRKSDIDLFIICSNKKDVNLAEYERKIGYKIQLFVFTRNEFEKMKEKNKELLNNIINGVSLNGYLEVFR